MTGSQLQISTKLQAPYFLTLSKVFYLVNHDILLHTLSHYGLHNNAIDWFKSYLHSRTQIHLFPGNNLPPGKSQPVCLRAETVLGPMLFLININELIIDCDFYTPSPTMFSDLKWMSFPERVIYIYIYMKATQMLKTIRGDAT